MAGTIRVGMIGCDTSHAVAYTKILHEDLAKDEPAVRVVACHPTFSPDIKTSVSRVDGFKKQLAEKWSVRIVDSTEAMIDDVDAFMIESVDGRRHLAEFKAIAAAGKPVYIDKPFAASLADARAIVDLAKKHKTPCFSSSSLRYDSNLARFMADKDARGEILGCDAFSPAHLEPTNPGWFWYGIHGVEILYTVMGPGCRRVQCLSTPDGDVAVGVWKDGRIGTMRGIRKGKAQYGATVLAEKLFQRIEPAGDFYVGLVREIATFLRTGKPPVPIDTTLEICAFIDGALRSVARGGDDVVLFAEGTAEH